MSLLLATCALATSCSNPKSGSEKNTPPFPSATFSTITGTTPTIADGTSFSTITITIRDKGNRPMAGYTPTFSATNSDGSNIYHSCSVGDANGRSTCTLSSGKAETKTLTITSPIVKSDGAVVFVPQTGVRLSFSVNPSSTGEAGVTLATQPQVTVWDSNDNVDWRSTASVTLALYSNPTCTTVASTTPNGTASLSGTLTLPFVNGIADFSGLKVNRAGSALYFRAISGTIPSQCSSLMNISATTYNVAESTVTSASTVISNNAVVATLTTKDRYGNPNPLGLPALGSIAFTYASAGGTATLSAISAAGSGVYTTNATGILVGSFTLGAIISGVAVGTNTTVSVSPGPAASLIFATAPSATGTAGTVLSTQPVIHAKDINGNIATGHTLSTTLSVHSDSTCSTAAIASGMVATLNPKAMTAGVVSFSGVDVRKTNAIAMKATDGTLSVCWNGMTIAPAAPDHLTFGTQPSSTAIAGATLGTPAAVHILDLYDNIATQSSASVTVALHSNNTCTAAVTTAPSGVSSLSGTSTIAATAGVSTYSNLTITKAATPLYLKASSGALTTACSSAVNVSPNAYNTSLSTVTAAATATSNIPITVTLTTKDAYGNLNPSGLPAFGSIAFTLNPTIGTGTLSGVVTDAGSGVYTTNFTGILVGAVSLGSTISGVAVSNPAAVTVVPGAATLFTFTTTPSATGTAGTPLATQPVITATDINGNIATGHAKAVTLTVHSDSSCSTAAIASGIAATANPKAPTAGVVSYGGVDVRKVNAIAMKASDVPAGGTLSTCFNGLTISPGPANKLAFTNTAITGTAGTVLATQPQVTVQDLYGNTATAATPDVTLALYSTAGCGTAAPTTPNGSSSTSGTLLSTAVNSVADFSGIIVNRSSAANYLGASATSLTSGCYGPFTITGAIYTPTESAVTTASGTVTSGASVVTTLTAKDVFGNTTATGMPAIGSIAFTSSVVGGTGTFGAKGNPSTGIYTSSFTGVTAGAVTLGATISGVAVSNNASVTVNPGAIASLSFQTQPAPVDTDTTLSSFTINALDAAGNIKTDDSASALTLTAYDAINCGGSIIASGISGTNPQTLSSGVGTFSDIKILKTSARSVKATIGAITRCSNNFTVSAGAPASIAVSSGDSQTQTITQALASPFVAIVKDANLNLISGRTVDWSVTSGGGSLSSSSNATNASGLSSSTLTLGSSLGTQSATATVNSTALSVVFSATATGPSLAWSPLSNDFGSVTIGDRSGSYPFTLTNSGTGSTSGCSAPTLSNNTDFRISIDHCGITNLAPSETCTVNVQAQPQSSGAKTTTLSRTCTVFGTPATTALAITTTGIDPAPSLSWLGTGVHFGDVEVGSNSAELNQILLSSGTGTASGCSAPILTGAQSADFSIVTDGCGTANLLSGKSCIVSVRANPTGTGASTATLSRTCSTGGTSTLTLSVNGTSSHPSSLARTGSDHHCAVLSDQTVKCWGLNSSGQLGDGTSTDRPLPTLVSSLINATSVSGGTGFTCALINDGTIQCWGLNSSGQLGDGTNTQRLTPVSVSGITTASQTSSGDSFACAVLSDHSVQCWGLNSSGQLGDGTTSNSNTPVNVSGISTATTVSSGYQSACAVLMNGSVWCWGTGILGDGNGTQTSTPVQVSGISTATDVTVGSNHACARLANNTLQCWGDNTYGQLGDGTTTQRLTPVSVSGITTATTVIAAPTLGGNSTCALLSGGSVKCWGDGQYTQLGNSSTASRLSPLTIIPAASTATALMLNEKGGCALTSGNLVQCWGSNSVGALGTGRTLTDDAKQTSANAVSGFNTATSISNGTNHSCAVLSDQTVKCVGSNTDGQLGNGTTSNYYSPTSVLGLTNATQIAAGSAHSCALLSTGGVECWGNNSDGALGDGTFTNRTTPVAVSGISSATSVVSGLSHSCALLSGGSVKCWGLNSSGQLGNADNTSVSTPVSVSGISSATAIAAGWNHTCALISGGTVQCWGANGSGRLGDGTTSDRSTPVSVTSLTDVTVITAGSNFSCALLSDGTLRCWGNNSSGAFGNANTTSSTTAIPAANSLGGITGLSALSTSVCAISGGVTRCFGSNTNGTLGDGTTTQRTSPVLTYGLPEGASLLMRNSSGATHSCTVDSLGAAYCWGQNTSAQGGFDFSKPTPTSGI